MQKAMSLANHAKRPVTTQVGDVSGDRLTGERRIHGIEPKTVPFRPRPDAAQRKVKGSIVAQNFTICAVA